MIENIFESRFSSFIENDNRKLRKFAQTTSESMFNKCVACLHPDEIKGKTILDLGCCIGAMGAWALKYGAAHYTGVEVQSEYSKCAEQELSKFFIQESFTIINDDIINFLIKNSSTFDIIICLGVVYSLTDILAFIKNITRISNELIIIDSLSTYHFYNGHAVFELITDQLMNVGEKSETFNSFIGVGLRPTIRAFNILFNNFSFEVEQIFPNPSKNCQDPYNDIVSFNSQKPITESTNRFLLKCTKNEKMEITRFPLLQEEIISNGTSRFSWPKFENQKDRIVFKSGEWKFDETIALRFRQEALNNIPDYIKVVDLSVKMVKNHFIDFKEKYVIDVGSAIGETVNSFVEDGFVNVYGVEKSKDMVAKSRHIDKIILSDTFPILGISKWDAVIINWTLHFIENREEYLHDVFNQMTENGILIITDKMDSDDLTKQQYIDFKKERGMTLEEIENKAKAIDGVLVTKPLSWYYEKLSKIGFKNIQTINSRLMFKTIIAFK